MMRIALLLPLALAGTGVACGPSEPPKANLKQATRSEAWPQMLAHCLRAPDCDPMTDIGDGAGEASNHAGEVTWFARKETPDGADAMLVMSLHASRGRGGEAGRTLTIDEHPDSLAGHTSRRSSLMFTYSQQAEGAPLLAGLGFRSAWVQPTDKTLQDYRVEISGARGVLLTESASAIPVEHAPGMKGLSPVTIRFARTGDSGVPGALLAALARGETLSLKITDASSKALLSDVIYSVGFESALEQAQAALRDPAIVASIPDRCAQLMREPDSFWGVANVTPALLVCDPRLPQERQ